MMFKVSDLMVKDVITVDPDETVLEAANKMKETGVSSLVVTRNKKVLGIITRSDFIDRVVAEAKDPRSTKVSEIMTKEVQVISPDSGIMDALKIMKEKRFSQLPVVSGDELVGIIAISDTLNYIAKFFMAGRWGQT